MPNLAGAAGWLSRHRDLGPRYLAENTGGNASDTLRSYGLSSLLGLAAVGYIQATNVLLGPIKDNFSGISLITMPEAAELLRRSPRHLPLFCAVVSIGLAVLSLAWGVVLLVALPRGLGHLMLGSIWRPTYPLVLPTTIALIGGCVSTGALLGLHALGAARRSLRAVILDRGAPPYRCPRGSGLRRYPRHNALLRCCSVARHAVVSGGSSDRRWAIRASPHPPGCGQSAQRKLITRPLQVTPRTAISIQRVRFLRGSRSDWTSGFPGRDTTRKLHQLVSQVFDASRESSAGESSRRVNGVTSRDAATVR